MFSEYQHRSSNSSVSGHEQRRKKSDSKEGAHAHSFGVTEEMKDSGLRPETFDAWITWSH